MVEHRCAPGARNHRSEPDGDAGRLAVMAAERSAARKIVHVDMDAFYAAVEQRDDASLRGRPVIVGGLPDSRGVVATCSYEARAFGVRSAMPASQARRLCPDAVFRRPRFDVYRAVSAEIRGILLDFTERVEAVSLDEAYLDVTGSQALRGSATLIALAIKQRIQATTGLTASAGVSCNQFLAKLASDRDKPDGFCRILPHEAPAILRAMPIGAFHGIGRATEGRMRALGIHTGEDLARAPLSRLREHFGKAGEYYAGLARGIDERPVNPDRPRKSFGAETTFQTDIDDPRHMLEQLVRLAGRVLDKLAAAGQCAGTLTIKVRYADFAQVTRSRTPGQPLLQIGDAMPHLVALLDQTEAGLRPVRLLGVSFSSLMPRGRPPGTQLDLFAEPAA